MGWDSVVLWRRLRWLCLEGGRIVSVAVLKQGCGAHIRSIEVVQFPPRTSRTLISRLSRLEEASLNSAAHCAYSDALIDCARIGGALRSGARALAWFCSGDGAQGEEGSSAQANAHNARRVRAQCARTLEATTSVLNPAPLIVARCEFVADSSG